MRIQRLPTEIKISGTGLSGLTAKLIKRDGQTVIYLRRDGYYEIGNLKILKAGEIFGKRYPVREAYFANEDFGVIAKTTRSSTEAERHFEMFKSLCI